MGITSWNPARSCRLSKYARTFDSMRLMHRRERMRERARARALERWQSASWSGRAVRCTFFAEGREYYTVRSEISLAELIVNWNHPCVEFFRPLL